MTSTRTPRTSSLALALLLLGTFAAAAQPAPYRAIPRHEVPNLLVEKVKEWAVGLPEVQALETYIRDKGDWSPRVLAAAGVAGAAFGYFEGGEGSFSLGAWDVSLDASGKELHRTLESRNGRLLGVGLGRPDMGWSAEAVLGLRQGRFLNQSFNLAYKIRY